MHFSSFADLLVCTGGLHCRTKRRLQARRAEGRLGGDGRGCFSGLQVLDISSDISNTTALAKRVDCPRTMFYFEQWSCQLNTRWYMMQDDTRLRQGLAAT